MGEGNLRTTTTLTMLALALGSTVTAQGVVYRERWGFAHLEERRAEVRAELVGRPPEAVLRAWDLLGEPDSGQPFVPVAKALAHLRGVAVDDAFVLRTAVGMFVLPEVCDPEAQNEVCRSINLSLFLPFTLPSPGTLTFDVVVVDSSGAERFRERLTKETDVAELRMARPTCHVPGAALPDGAYRVTVSTRIDGLAPPAQHPVREWTFHVLRGYQARAERALATAQGLGQTLPAVAAAPVLGAASAVARAFYGEAFVGPSDGVRDLQRLETMLANVAAEKQVLDGITGDLPLAIAGPGGVLAGVLRLCAPAPRPLVVFVPGLPSYDGVMNHPTAPATYDPRWRARDLADFGTAHGVHVAFLESPGGGRDFGPLLQSALAMLGQLVPPTDQKPLLVGEREAAVAVALHIARFRPLVSGLVFVGSGAMPATSLRTLGKLPVRVAATRGPAEAALQGMLDYLANQKENPLAVDIEWLSPARPPWLLGTSPFAAELGAFARKLFAR